MRRAARLAALIAAAVVSRSTERSPAAIGLHFVSRPGSELRRSNLDNAQRADLVAFLDSLTDRDFVTDPRFALPKTACGKKL